MPVRIPTAPSVEEPDLSLLHDGLRLEVGVLRVRHDHGRNVSSVLHLGVPGGHRAVAPLPAAADPLLADAGFRTDLAARLGELALDRGLPLHAWLTRDGDLELLTGDRAWWPALRGALAASGQAPAGLHVVTKTGWCDVLAGERRTWKRLRVRSRAGEAVVRQLAQEADQSQEWTGSFACIRST
ncbi:hypothetical protein [Nocardioides sp.]|uniref:hypothetical protein n=1 Tax=Nocardioides sp. TaxID=35761 RepID=UPI0027326567|nr:hypothetical protein [Nocardioides sp.]MDP3890152.1 hypothetical protein [Nocardioides sp.]